MATDAGSEIPQWHVAEDWFDVCRCVTSPALAPSRRPPTDNYCEGVNAMREGLTVEQESAAAAVQRRIYTSTYGLPYLRLPSTLHLNVGLIV